MGKLAESFPHFKEKILKNVGIIPNWDELEDLDASIYIEITMEYLKLKINTTSSWLKFHIPMAHVVVQIMANVPYLEDIIENDDYIRFFNEYNIEIPLDPTYDEQIYFLSSFLARVIPSFSETVVPIFCSYTKVSSAFLSVTREIVFLCLSL